MKKRIVSLMIIGIMATALCACSDAADSNTAPEETAVVEEQEAATEVASEEAEAAEEAAQEAEVVEDTSEEAEVEDTTEEVAEESEETVEVSEEAEAFGEPYKQIYKGVVDELSSTGNADQFALVYVDNDDIPELVAVSSEGSWDKDQVFLYTTDGSEAVLLASDIAPGMEGHYIAFFEKENLFIKSGGAMGDNYVFYSIEDSQPKQIMSASYFIMIDADDNEVESYMVDEEDVTPDVYTTALKGAIPSVGMTKIAETDSTEMVKYDVSLDDGYMALTEIERLPYSSYDEIIEQLK